MTAENEKQMKKLRQMLKEMCSQDQWDPYAVDGVRDQVTIFMNVYPYLDEYRKLVRRVRRKFILQLSQTRYQKIEDITEISEHLVFLGTHKGRATE